MKLWAMAFSLRKLFFFLLISCFCLSPLILHRLYSQNLKSWTVCGFLIYEVCFRYSSLVCTVSIAQSLGMLTQLADQGLLWSPFLSLHVFVLPEHSSIRMGKYLTIAIRIIFQPLPVRYVTTCIFPAIHPVACLEESFISEPHRTFFSYFVILCFSICHTLFLSRL